VDTDPDLAYLKIQISAFNPLPAEGTVFISVNDRDKDTALEVARNIAEAGFTICATKVTMIHLLQNGIECDRAYKVWEGRRPNIVDRIKNNEICFVVNTPGSHDARADEVAIRAAAVSTGISYATDISSARACAAAILHSKNKVTEVRTLQELHASNQG